MTTTPTTVAKITPARLVRAFENVLAAGFPLFLTQTGRYTTITPKVEVEFGYGASVEGTYEADGVPVNGPPKSFEDLYLEFGAWLGALFGAGPVTISDALRLRLQGTLFSWFFDPVDGVKMPPPSND